MIKVLSITPAPAGWFSVYRESDDGHSEMRVALWALVEKPDDEGKVFSYPTSFSIGEGPGSYLEPMPDDETKNFIGYVYREPPSSPLHLDGKGKPAG